VQRAALARLQDDAADPRIQRQPRQLGAHRRELVVVVHRAQFVQQSGSRPAMARREGGSMKGNSSTPPRRSDFMRRITPASEERRISGSVKRGRPLKSFSS
jgi:hypothetical protein